MFDTARVGIEDDGQGFVGVETVVVAALEGHMRIAGMRERIRTLGGTFRISLEARRRNGDRSRDSAAKLAMSLSRDP